MQAAEDQGHLIISPRRGYALTKSAIGEMKEFDGPAVKM
jgi:hypothetical protein